MIKRRKVKYIKKGNYLPVQLMKYKLNFCSENVQKKVFDEFEQDDVLKC